MNKKRTEVLDLPELLYSCEMFGNDVLVVYWKFKENTGRIINPIKTDIDRLNQYRSWEYPDKRAGDALVDNFKNYIMAIKAMIATNRQENERLLSQKKNIEKLVKMMKQEGNEK